MHLEKETYSEKKSLTNKRTIATIGIFSLPIVGGNLLQQFYTVINSVIIGRYYGADGLSAIGVAASIVSFLTFIIFGFGIGMTVLLSKYYGTRDFVKFKAVASTSLICGLLFTVCLSALCISAAYPILRIFQTPDAIIDSSALYLRVMCVGLIFSFLYNFYNAALLALGNSKLPFIVLSVATVTNISLTWIFAINLGLGVLGAALASVLSQLLSVLLCRAYAKRHADLLVFKRKELVVDMIFLKEVVGYGGASAFQQMLFSGGKLLVQGAVNTLGVQVIAGYSVAVQIEAFVLSALEGIATSTSRYCAENLGEGKEREVRSGFFAGLAVSMGYTVFISSLIWVFSPKLIALFMAEQETVALQSGTVYLKYMAVFYLAGGVAQVMQSLYRGIGRMSVASAATVLQMTFRIGLTYLLVTHIGVVAVSFATFIGWIAMIMYESILAHRYFKSIV